MNLHVNKKQSLFLGIISLALTNLATFYFTNKEKAAAENQSEQVDASLYASNSDCAVKVKRLNGYDFIKPVLFVDKACESDKLNPIKQKVTALIDEYKRLGDITSATLYLKEYSGNEWIGINNDEKFLPGSLMKVPELISILKMEEANPGFLNKQLTYEKAFDVNKKPKYLSKSIQLGHSYSVKELLDYMIIYSDNNAASLLFNNMNLSTFKKVFTDMGLEAPDLTAQNYPITAKDYSIFMRILYNSSYLSNKHSEYATELLGKCDFKEGLVSGFPSSVRAAHKFGESGDPLHQELGESAIVYLDNNPYVLTVMLKAKEQTKLPGIIKQISELVYQNLLSSAKITS